MNINNTNLTEKYTAHLKTIKDSSTACSCLDNLKILYETLQYTDPTEEIINSLNKIIIQKENISFSIREKWFNYYYEIATELNNILKNNKNIQIDQNSLTNLTDILEYRLCFIPNDLIDYLKETIKKTARIILKQNPESYITISKYLKIHSIPFDKYEMLEFHQIHNLLPSPFFNKYLNNPKEFYQKLESDPILNLFFIKILILHRPRSNFNLLLNSIKNNSKNFREMENNILSGKVAFFLLRFNNNNRSEYPFSLNQLKKLCEHFLNILQREITFSSITKTKYHWRKQQNIEDTETLTPYIEKGWIEAIRNTSYPGTISIEKLATKIYQTLPSSLSLNVKGEKILPRIKNALKNMDPRLYSPKGGKCLGLKPKWEKFNHH